MWQYIGIALAVAAAASLVWGCASNQAKDAGLAAAHVVALEDAYDDAKAIDEAHIDDVPAKRRDKVKEAWATIEAVHQRVQDADTRKLVTNVDQARPIYAQAKQAYKTLRPVVGEMVDKGSIDGAQAAQLKRLDERARALDERLQSIDENTSEDTAAMLKAARDVIPVIGKVILALV